MKRYTQTHDTHLNKSRNVTARGSSAKINRRTSAMTREDAGVDCESPWIASCDKHGEMIGCNTKRDATDSARHSTEWCSGCQKEMTREEVQAELDRLGIDIQPALERVKKMLGRAP